MDEEREVAITVLRPSAEQWAAARAQALAGAGLSFQELAEQARTGDYQSAAARSLWITFGS